MNKKLQVHDILALILFYILLPSLGGYYFYLIVREEASTGALASIFLWSVTLLFHSLFSKLEANRFVEKKLNRHAYLLNWSWLLFLITPAVGGCWRYLQ